MLQQINNYLINRKIDLISGCSGQSDGENYDCVKQNYDEALSDIYVLCGELISSPAYLTAVTYRKFFTCLEIGHII